MKKLYYLFASALCLLSMWGLPAHAGNVTVSTLAELQSAISGSADTIVVSQTISITETMEIDGAGKVIMVPVPYMNADGKAHGGGYSSFNIFTISSSAHVTLKNMTLLGGSGSYAGCVNMSGAYLYAENVQFTRAYRGIYFSGSKAVLKNCNIVRNVCGYGGGMLLSSNSQVLMDGCSLSENRSLSSSGGGGAMEIQSGCKFYAINTVIANNCSSELGGAINLYYGTTYLLGCTLTGNTSVTTYGKRAGGAIGVNGGYVYAANSVIMDNCHFTNLQSEMSRSDLGLFSGDQSNICVYNSIYGSATNNDGEVTITGVNNQQADNDTPVYAAYRQDGVLSMESNQTPGFKHSVLTAKPGTQYCLYAPLGTGSATGGVACYASYDNTLTEVKMGYDSNGTIVGLGDLTAPAANKKITTYYEGTPRVDGTIGASAIDTRTYYTVKLDHNVQHASVSGVTVFGDSYVAGTEITIHAQQIEPDYYIRGWRNVETAELMSYSRDYTFAVNGNLTVIPEITQDDHYVIAVPAAYQVKEVLSNGTLTALKENGYRMDTTVVVKAIVPQYYELTYWADANGNPVATANPLTIQMEPHDTILRPMIVAGEYYSILADDYTLYEVKSDASQVDTKNYLYKGDTTVNISVSAPFGYEFLYWANANGDSLTNALPLPVQMAAHDTILYPVFQAELADFDANGFVNGTHDMSLDYHWAKYSGKPGVSFASYTMNMDGSRAIDTLVLTPQYEYPYMLHFDWAVSSESYYDVLTIAVNNTTVVNRSSGTNHGLFASTDSISGVTKIALNYEKDGGDASGDDRGYIYNIWCKTRPINFAAEDTTVYGASYTWHGRTLTESGQYKDTIYYPDNDIKATYTLNLTLQSWTYRASNDTIYAEIGTGADAIVKYATIAQADFTYNGDTAKAVVTLQEGFPLSKNDLTISYVDANNDPIDYAVEAGSYAALMTYDTLVAKASFTINKKAATVTAQDDSKTYGDTDPILAMDTTGLVAGDQLTGITITRVAGENAGTYAINATAAESANPNYTLSFVPATFTINKKAATVTAQDNSKTYGDTDPVFTLDTTGLVGSDVLTGITLSREEGENVGTYAIHATAAESANPNYTLTFVPATFTISPKAATVTAQNSSKTYGDSDPIFTMDTTGLVGSDVLTGITISRAEGENVGTYAIHATAAESANPNYTLTFVPATFTISPKAATVQADDKEKYYGSFDPELTFTATGLVGTDVLSGITLSRTTGETIGSYTILATATEAANPNYTLTFVPGMLTISPMKLEEVAGGENEYFIVSAAGYCQGDEAGIQYAIEAGNPVAYSITFGAEAKAQGFVDVPTTPVPAGDIKSLDVVIPMNCHYGKYSADVYFYNALGIEPIKQSVTFTVNIPVVDIHQLFYDVVAIDNNEGLYNSYQWYHNGELIPGATLQYYQQEGGLTGIYYVEVTVEGLDYEARSCEEEYEDKAQAPAVRKVLRSNQVVIITPEDKEYDVNGAKIK